MSSQAPKPASDAQDRPRPLPTRQRQREETRNLIFQVAMQEISEVGLAKSRIEHIARKAGVTRPTFYAHFPSKEDLLRELQSRTERSTLEALRTRLDGENEDGLIHGLVDATFDLVSGADPVLRREAFGLMVREPRESEWMDDALFAFLGEKLAEAQRRGEIADAVSAHDLTRILMTALFGFMAIEGGTLGKRRALAHQLMSLVVAGAADSISSST
jgi:AcrR family transcriptional regulator